MSLWSFFIFYILLFFLPFKFELLLFSYPDNNSIIFLAKPAFWGICKSSPKIPPLHQNCLNIFNLLKAKGCFESIKKTIYKYKNKMTYKHKINSKLRIKCFCVYSQPFPFYVIIWNQINIRQLCSLHDKLIPQYL